MSIIFFVFFSHVLSFLEDSCDSELVNIVLDIANSQQFCRKLSEHIPLIREDIYHSVYCEIYPLLLLAFDQVLAQNMGFCL